MSEELYHHGIKGQKWGVRRYQNSDGSLTDEGRRRYGYGRDSSRLITRNTLGRTKQGAKIGAKIGAGLGVAGTGIGLATFAAAGVPVSAPLAISYGATWLASYASSGAINGALVGGIVGAVETHKGRQYIERYDKGLDEFEMRDLNRKAPR